MTSTILRSTGQPNISVLYGGNERTHIQWFCGGYLSRVSYYRRSILTPCRAWCLVLARCRRENRRKPSPRRARRRRRQPRRRRQRNRPRWALCQRKHAQNGCFGAGKGKRARQEALSRAKTPNSGDEGSAASGWSQLRSVGSVVPRSRLLGIVKGPSGPSSPPAGRVPRACGAWAENDWGLGLWGQHARQGGKTANRHAATAL